MLLIVGLILFCFIQMSYYNYLSAPGYHTSIHYCWTWVSPALIVALRKKDNQVLWYMNKKPPVF